MRVKHIKYVVGNSILLYLALGAYSLPSVAADDLFTLFTTPQERQVINTNRYKTEQINRAPEKNVEPERMLDLVKEEVKKSFEINGITMSNEGQHSVWINDDIYQDGEQIDGKSRVRVLVDNGVRVRITAPDGKHYYGTSGETLEITYLEAPDS